MVTGRTPITGFHVIDDARRNENNHKETKPNEPARATD